jgi:hypothetical protein
MSIVVCLAPDAAGDVVAAIDAAMAPFEAMQGFPAERDQWESWSVVGGSDGTGFRIVPGAEDDPRLIHDQPHWDGGPRPGMPGMCAGGPRGILDLTSDGAEAAAAAGQLWDLFHALRGELPPALPLAHFMALPEHQVPYVPVGRAADGTYRLMPDPGWQAAQRQYHAQPLVRRLRAAPCFAEGVVAELPEMLPWFDLPRQEYVDRRFEAARRGSELLTLDGWWIELGYPPVHGACESRAACTHRAGMTEPWTREAMATYLERLPDDVVVVRLRCKV